MKTALVALWCAAFFAGVAQGSASNPQSAATNWLDRCASCHGDDGRGLTPKGKSTKARDLTSPEVQRDRTDAQFVKSIRHGFLDKNGKALMPFYDTEELTTDEVRDIVAYVRALQKK